jgi:hypothetical protein
VDRVGAATAIARPTAGGVRPHPATDDELSDHRESSELMRLSRQPAAAR